MTTKHVRIMVSLFVLLLMPAARMMACPVCFGETESGSAVGVNAAVWVMMGITGTVLGLFSALIIRFRNRMKMALETESAARETPESSKEHS